MFRVQNYQNVDSTPKKKPKQKDKTTTNTHFRTNKIRNSSKKIKRPQSERKKSKPRPQNPYDEKSKPQRYHINILTPGKLKPKKNKSNTKSVLKTTATTKKSNINSDTMLGNPYTYSIIISFFLYNLDLLKIIRYNLLFLIFKYRCLKRKIKRSNSKASKNLPQDVSPRSL